MHEVEQKRQSIDKTNHTTYLARAEAVLNLEALALTDLSYAIPKDFCATVDLILASVGRVIVSGVGKSGHVARKISATLSSTGTPSFFMHPTEASHGDLGMITPQDVCLLISNSGETAELGDVLVYARRFCVPVIGISKCSDSTLMKSADFKLTLPTHREACAIGMAPTTSTTLAMALGDALAVSLMEARGFKPENFRIFHPGGKLGAQLVHVSQLMHSVNKVPRVSEYTTMPGVLLAMTSGGFGVAAIVDGDDKLLGVVTDGDLRRNMHILMEQTAGDIATREPIIACPDTLAVDALALMNERAITVLLVVNEQQRLKGILHIHDLLRAGVV